MDDGEDKPPRKNSISPSTSTTPRKKTAKHRRLRSEPPKPATFSPSSSYDTFSNRLLTEEEAEETLVRVLEERQRRASLTRAWSDENNDGWRSAVEGERRPLGRVTFQGEQNILDYDRPKAEEAVAATVAVSAARQRFINLAQKVRTMKKEGKLGGGIIPAADEHEKGATSPPHRRDSNLESVHEEQEGDKEEDINGEKQEDDEVLPKVSGMFDGVGGEETDMGKSEFSHANTNTDRLIEAAVALDENFLNKGSSDHDEDESVATEGSLTSFFTNNEEQLPLVMTTTGAPPLSSFQQPQRMRRRRSTRHRWCYRGKKYCRRTLRRWSRKSGAMAKAVLQAVSNFLLHSWFTKIGVPCLFGACILFYTMGNPTLLFVKTRATASWWLIFAARQLLTLELAVMTQAVCIDGLAMQSRWVVQLCGPLLTLFVINSKGWPFVVTSWAIWDLFILHGSTAFQRNWLFWMDIAVFSPANKGATLIDSNQYLRVLVAMVLAGVATAVKRLTLAMYFGKKTFVNYKPRLESILAEIVLITEVAELAREAGNLTGLANEKDATLNEALTETKQKGAFRHSEKWESVKKFESKGGKISSSELYSSSDRTGETPIRAVPEEDESLTSDDEGEEDADKDSSESESDSESEDDSDNNTTPQSLESSQKIHFRHGSNYGSSSVGTSKIKHLLDRWEEPDANRSDKSTAEASISDILRFRKALSFMDDDYPFSLSFGVATTRDQCIKSAQKTYRKLMRLERGSAVLSFDVIGLLAFEEDGTEDEVKKMAYKRLFRPDRNNEVSLLAFVQGCDSVYRKLRYFRASVGNSSVIDRVLEQIIDSLFYFVLALVVLTLLDINPWPLLVSISTLLVSFAFAVGPSASRYIEGILLIAARRPYDLGDRICVVKSESLVDPDPNNSWFVEDINLFCTTLRFAPTNQVATVNNGVLAVSRIVNCNRSTNALITLTLQFQVSATGDQLELFREAVDKFVEDRPRLWEQVVFFRCDKIDQNIELIECTLRVQHRKAWQDAGSIMMNQSELLKFCYEMGKKLDINYNRFPPPQRVFTWYESVKESSLSLDEVITSPGLSKRFASKEEKAQPDRATSRVFDEFLRQEVEK